MRAGKRLTKWIATLSAAALFLATPLTARADGTPIVDNQDGVIAVVYHDHNNEPIRGMRVLLYQVATVSGEIWGENGNSMELEYKLTPDFAQFDEQNGSTKVTGFSEEGINEALKVREGETTAERRARWQSIAKTLEQYAPTVPMTRSDRTNADGEVRFQNLSPGLYLLVAAGQFVQEEDSDWTYRYDPAFVALPGLTDGTWDYVIGLDYNDNNEALRPKYSYDSVDYEFEVYKRWIGDSAAVRPGGVVVDIYRDGVLFETVTLNEANGWRYTWRSGSRHRWTVTERTTPTGYSVDIASGKAGSFTLTNTLVPPPPETEGPPPEEPPVGGGEEGDVLGARRTFTDDPAVLGARRLPRTGQLWWPVPILAGAGILFLAAGLATRKSSR